jgi:diguanylate cyclase (GGDEF)-like protein
MKNNIGISNLLKTQSEKFSSTEIVLLKWIESIIAFVCFIVLIYTTLFSPSPRQINQGYTILVSIEIIILISALIFYKRKNLVWSSNLLILAGLIGPWWSVIFDDTIINGNLLPLVYTSIPILFASFFSPVYAVISIGILQFLGVAAFIYFRHFDLSMGAASLLFFIIFVFATSLIISIQNRNNRQTIFAQVEQLKEQVIRDPLTGLYNRRFPFEFLKKEFAKLNRSGGILSIIIFDIDDFKYYNDTYGHDCGDDIMVFISGLITKNFRESDVSCRFGGDEFFIAMSGADLEEAKKRAASLQDMIAKGKFTHFSKGETPVTISIGIAAYPIHGETVDEVLKAADQALYTAKELGKNRIEIEGIV